jgi:hypothetical protein
MNFHCLYYSYYYYASNILFHLKQTSIDRLLPGLQSQLLFYFIFYFFYKKYINKRKKYCKNQYIFYKLLYLLENIKIHKNKKNKINIA